MNERSIIKTPGAAGRAGWLDAYMPEGQLAYAPPGARFISLATIRGILFRQRWLIAAVVFAAAIAGLVITLLAAPMYQATASVRIDPQGSWIVEGQDLEVGVPASQVYDLLATQIGIITSRSLATTVAEDLSLGEREEFIGPEIEKSRPANISDEQWGQQKQNIAASILHGSISAEIDGDGWIIAITYRSPDPTIAAEVANAYAAAFVATDTRASIENNEYAQNYLREQIEQTQGRLQQAELAANAYARDNRIIVQTSTVADGVESSATLTTTNLASINARASAARAARIEAEQRWRSVENIPAAQLREVQSSSALQGLNMERATKRVQLAELRQRYNDDFPQITSLLAQIATLDDQIARSSSDIKASFRNEYLVARSQERALEVELNSLTADTLAEQDRQVQFSVLEREARALQEQLQVLLTRFNQLNAAANVRSGVINPLDAAVVPGAPYAPNLFKNMALALILGMALAAALAVLREIFDDKIRSFEEVEEKTGLPLLGYTPHVAESDIDDNAILMEAYASVRAIIDFAIPEGRNAIQFTSCQASEGKTTSIVAIAELFARHGRRTLLVDGDLRRPSVGKHFDAKGTRFGLVEVLLGEADIQSAIIKSGHENLDILPVREPLANPGEIFASIHLRRFIEKCREHYSLILFDSSPILGLADAPMLSSVVDGTVVVVEANRAHFGQVRSAIKRLRASGGNPIGVVLTKYRAMQAGDSYDYQYRYYKYESAQ